MAIREILSPTHIQHEASLKISDIICQDDEIDIKDKSYQVALAIENSIEHDLILSDVDQRKFWNEMILHMAKKVNGKYIFDRMVRE